MPSEKQPVMKAPPPRGPGAMRGGPKAKDVKGTFRRVLKYVMRYKFRMLLVLVCILLSSVAGTVGSLFLQSLIDDYIAPMLKTPGLDLFADLLWAMGMLALVYILGMLSTLVSNLLMVTISQRILKDIRDNMFAHMQTLPIRYFDAHTHGDIMSHYTNDTDTLRQLIGGTIPQICSSTITVVVVFFSMLYRSPFLTLMVLIFVALMMVVTRKVGGGSAKYFVKQQMSLGKINGFIEEMINGQKVVKVFCHEDKAKEQFDRLNNELCHNAAKANGYANIMGPIMNNLGHVQFVIIAIIGGAVALAGAGGWFFAGFGGASLSLGAIVSFLQLSRSFNMPINQVAQQISAIAMALAGAERIFELMDEKPEADDGYVTLVNARVDDEGCITESESRTGIWAWKHPHHDGTLTYTRLTGDVRFFGVDFAYAPGKTVLHDVSLYAKPGQKLAFVGATGAGKTTITNLINRFYDIEDGKIRYDGININKIKKDDLRRSLGVVLQDVNLFTGTVMENIRYGKLDATDEECIAAAKLANAHTFISMLPHGYDTILEGDGSGLSQGQRQLLSIARAAVSDPPVMILDEATSSIDTRTEALVQKGMDQLMQGRTVFVIAHRLSTVKNSNAILVLEHGRVIERGDHQQLIEEKGKYYQLYTGAFELE